MAPSPRLRGIDADLPPTHWRKRIRCFTLQWYTCVMGTGGLAFLIDQINVAYGGQWLITLGDIVYVYNLVLFVLVTGLMIARFIMYPPAIRHVLFHPQESSFLPCFPLALATLIASAAAYGTRDTGYWLVKTTLVWWWIDVFLGLLTALIVPVIQWTSQTHPLEEWSPMWLLPPLDIVFTGAVAYEISLKLPSYTAVWLIITAYVLVGFGCLIGMLYGAGWIVRLMVYGSPPGKMAPVFNLLAGPIAWGSYGVIALGLAAATNFPTAIAGGPFLGNPMSGEIFSIASLCIGLFIYGLSWFVVGTALIYFGYSIYTCDLALSTMALNNWGLTFPLTGHVAISFILGTRFESRFMTDLGIVQTVILTLLWLYATLTTIYGVAVGKVCAEGCDINQPAFGYYGDYEKVEEDEADDKSPERKPETV